MPLSASAMINKEEVIELLDEAIDRLPDELRDARWLRKEREEYLAKMRADGDEITDAARARAEQMVQRTEVVKAAEHRARRIVERAEAEARRLRLECEDFCDQKLAASRSCWSAPSSWVAKGREKLQATSTPMPELEGLDDSGFFDDDRG
jgi:cell division septum initiation protein DivIVA